MLMFLLKFVVVRIVSSPMDTRLSDTQPIMLPSGAMVARLPWKPPEQIFAPLANTPFALWFDSSSADNKDSLPTARARYSFIVSAPYAEIIGAADWAQIAQLEAHLSPYHADIWEGLSPQQNSNLPPFRGGIAGVLAYDYARLWAQKNAMPHTHILNSVSDIAFGVYGHVLAFDHERQQCFGFASGAPAQTIAARKRGAEAALANMETQICHAPPLAPPASRTYHHNMCQSNFTRDAYQASISKIIAHIYDGDIFQANLAQCFTLTLADDDSDFAFYRRYRRSNPAPFAAFAQYGDWSLACASPERFLSIHNGILEARPIKGTSACSNASIDNSKIADALATNPKERAENIMIVDVLRNDLSRTCIATSIDVPQLCVVEKFAHMQHLTSVVRGKLRSDKAPLQALLAAFPGGSITGAPKIRAMQRIAQYEPNPRGAYCGALGYIGFDGTMDMNIIIRSAQINANRITYHAGGGITAQSVPAHEYDETYIKAAGFFESLGLPKTMRCA